MIKNIKEFPQGIEGIRKQGYELMERGNEADIISGKKFLCKYDLKYLCTEQLGYKDWDKVHDDIQKFMDTIKFGTKDNQFRLLLIPRGHLKSSMVTKGWSIQQALRDSNVRILIANAIWDNARGFVRTIMQLLTGGSELDKLFGAFIPRDRLKKGLKWGADGITIDQRTTPLDSATITSTGVERTQTSQHYDIIILDDVVARENITTKEQREKVRNFYRDCQALLDPGGIMIVIGTTWHEDDLYSSSEYGLIHDPDFVVFKRVAEKGNQRSVLFKKKFSYESLMKKKSKIGNYSYSAQYLLNPYPEEDMTFHKNWIRYWKFPEEHTMAARVLSGEKLYVAITIDPSLGKENSDNSAIVSVGINSKREKFVLEAKRYRRKVELMPDEVIKTVKGLISKGFHPNIIGLESFGFQQMLLTPIKEAMKKSGLNVPVELLPAANNRTSKKELRIESLVPDFHGYDIFLHETQKDLIEELLRFNPTIRNKYDDLIDALAWNKVYWHRRPQHKIKQKINPGCIAWFLRKSRYDQKIDLFSEYRQGINNG